MENSNEQQKWKRVAIATLACLSLASCNNEKPDIPKPQPTKSISDRIGDKILRDYNITE